MKYCPAHIETIKAALAAADLLAFVSPDSEEALSRMEAKQREGRVTLQNLDVLMEMQHAIAYATVGSFGPVRIGHEDACAGWHLCPICWTIGRLEGPSGGKATAEEMCRAAAAALAELVERLRAEALAHG